MQALDAACSCFSHDESNHWRGRIFGCTTDTGSASRQNEIVCDLKRDNVGGCDVMTKSGMPTLKVMLLGERASAAWNGADIPRWSTLPPPYTGLGGLTGGDLLLDDFLWAFAAG